MPCPFKTFVFLGGGHHDQREGAEFAEIPEDVLLHHAGRLSQSGRAIFRIFTELFLGTKRRLHSQVEPSLGYLQGYSLRCKTKTPQPGRAIFRIFTELFFGTKRRLHSQVELSLGYLQNFSQVQKEDSQPSRAIYKIIYIISGIAR